MINHVNIAKCPVHSLSLGPRAPGLHESPHTGRPKHTQNKVPTAFAFSVDPTNPRVRMLSHPGGQSCALSRVWGVLRPSHPASRGSGSTAPALAPSAEERYREGAQHWVEAGAFLETKCAPQGVLSISWLSVSQVFSFHLLIRYLQSRDAGPHRPASKTSSQIMYPRYFIRSETLDPRSGVLYKGGFFPPFFTSRGLVGGGVP